MRLRYALPTALGLALLLGCGDDGVTRYRLTGKVTFAGAPVPAGQLVFTPVKGPPGHAEIKNGEYDTANGLGIVGGPHAVRIEGYEPGSGQGDEPGKTLFREYEEKRDLPSENGTQNFDVPATAVAAGTAGGHTGP